MQTALEWHLEFLKSTSNIIVRICDLLMVTIPISRKTNAQVVKLKCAKVFRDSAHTTFHFYKSMKAITFNDGQDVKDTQFEIIAFTPSVKDRFNYNGNVFFPSKLFFYSVQFTFYYIKVNKCHIYLFIRGICQKNIMTL